MSLNFRDTCSERTFEQEKTWQLLFLLQLGHWPFSKVKGLSTVLMCADCLAAVGMAPAPTPP